MIVGMDKDILPGAAQEFSWVEAGRKVIETVEALRYRHERVKCRLEPSANARRMATLVSSRIHYDTHHTSGIF